MQPRLVRCHLKGQCERNTCELLLLQLEVCNDLVLQAQLLRMSSTIAAQLGG